jgi:hypothetical protein
MARTAPPSARKANPLIAEESSPATYVTIAAVSSMVAKRFTKDDSVLEKLFLGLSSLPIRDASRHSNLRRLGHPIMLHFHRNLHRRFARDEKNITRLLLTPLNALGAKGIFLASKGTILLRLTPNILTRSYVPLSKLLPRATALVHNGVLAPHPRH